MPEIFQLLEWLGLTRQQMNIIEAILRLQKKGAIPSPKSIIDEDADFRDAPKIQKSNFFAQLKSLQGRRYVRKVGEAAYAIDFRAISSSLDNAQENANKELEQMDRLRKETEQYFKQISSGEKKPVVEFIEYEYMYDKVADTVKNAKTCLISRAFPRILYARSPSLVYTPHARRYAQTFWDRCIEDKAMDVTYLTTFDINYIFQRLFSAYKNPTLAYDEVKMIINGIEETLKQNEKLNIYYLESSYCLDMIIPYSEEINELFLIVRDETRRGIGAIHISSPDLVARFKRLYEEECSRALDMRSEKGKEVIKKLNAKLDAVYSRYKSKKR